MERSTDRIRECFSAAWKRFCDDMRIYRIGVACAAGALLLVQLLFGTICPMQLVFGLPCPGCGLTRAVMLLFSGAISESISMHLMAIPALILILLFPIFRYFYPRGFTIWRKCAIIWLVLTLIFFVYRMLTQFPGEEPICFYDGWLQQITSVLTGA